MTYPGDPGYTPYEAPPEHKWADLFRDVPMTGQWVGKIWVAGRGVLTLPHTASRLAEHAELVGLRLDESKAKIVRVGPTRGGPHLAAAGHWQDVTKPLPDVNPIAAVKEVAQDLTPAEKAQLVADLQADLDDIV